MTRETFSKIERQQKIIDLLNRQLRISVSDVSEIFSISEATARRDLESLAKHNHLQRVHGGAISNKKAPPELPIFKRETAQTEEKQRIAEAAANLIHDGNTVFLGSGTTVFEVARLIRERKRLTVITNSLPVLNTLSSLPEITVVALGGILRNTELSFIGHITQQALAEIRVDKVFISIYAVNIEQGLTNDHLPEAMTDRAILKSGQEVIVLADHTKVNRVSLAFLAPITDIHKFVTDKQTPKDFIKKLQEYGVEVISV